MKIAYSGTHGTRKSASVLNHAAKIKEENIDSTVEVITEVARKNPFQLLNKEATRESQL